MHARKIEGTRATASVEGPITLSSSGEDALLLLLLLPLLPLPLTCKSTQPKQREVTNTRGKQGRKRSKFRLAFTPTLHKLPNPNSPSPFTTTGSKPLPQKSDQKKNRDLLLAQSKSKRPGAYPAALLLPRRVVKLALDPEAAGTELEVVGAVRLPEPAREAHLGIRRPGPRRRRLSPRLLGGDLISSTTSDGGRDRDGVWLWDVVPARGLREPAGDGDAQPGELFLDRVSVRGVPGADGGGGDRGDRRGCGVGGQAVGVGVRHWSAEVRGERRGGDGDGDGDERAKESRWGSTAKLEKPLRSVLEGLALKRSMPNQSSNILSYNTNFKVWM